MMGDDVATFSLTKLGQRVFWPVVLGIVGTSVTACAPNLTGFGDRGPTSGDRPDPYVQFTESARTIEPLISPELEALTQSQSLTQLSRSSANTLQLPPVNPMQVNVDISMASSGKLVNLNKSMYENFIQDGYSGVMDIKILSPKAAVKQFCGPEKLDIVIFSGPLSADDIEQCQAKNYQPIGFAIGKDAIVLVVKQQDTFVQGITLDSLKKIVLGQRWSQIDASWPNKSIRPRLVGPESPAVTVLADTLFDGSKAPIVNAPNTTFYNYPDPMVQTLSTAADSVGLFGYSIFLRFPSGFRVVPINGITPSPETIASGAYPLLQTLYLYVDQSQLTRRSPVAKWVNYYLTHASETMAGVYLLPLSTSQLNASKQKWLIEVN